MQEIEGVHLKKNLILKKQKSKNLGYFKLVTENDLENYFNM